MLLVSIWIVLVTALGTLWVLATKRGEIDILIRILTRTGKNTSWKVVLFVFVVDVPPPNYNKDPFNLVLVKFTTNYDFTQQIYHIKSFILHNSQWRISHKTRLRITNLTECMHPAVFTVSVIPLSVECCVVSVNAVFLTVLVAIRLPRCPVGIVQAPSFTLPNEFSFHQAVIQANPIDKFS